MAQPNYSEGVAEIKPSGEGAPYQTGAGATPDAFGAGIGQGLEKLGAGATTSSKFFGKVVADNASNDFQDYASKLLHGDSTKQVLGPDGQMMPDTGYLGTKGRAALDARPGVEKALDEKIKEIRSTLSTPEQQQEFENFSRRYRTGTVEKVGSHADAQASTWYTGVNTASAKLAMDHIANNFENPKEVAAGAADLTAAYVRNAQIQGATADSPQMKEAFAAARRDALQAQLNAMAVKDPSRALAVLDKNKDIAGVQYDNLANSFRTRSEHQRGIDVGEQALKKTYTAPAVAGYTNVNLTDVGAPYGVSGTYLQRTQQIENANFDQRENSAGAQGPFQFTRSTAQRYGLSLADRLDYQKSADAAARLAADNKASLASSLGRPPTDPELYLAHQQGAGGAAKLLAYPNMRAGDLVGDAAIRQNGGNPDLPALAFTSMWTAKFNGTAGTANASRKAMAFQDIMSDPSLNAPERQHALTYVNQQIAAQSIAEEQDAKSRKAATDAMQSQLVTTIINGSDPSIIQTIANSPLGASEKENLFKFATDQGGIQNDAQYGPGYTQAFKAVLASPDDPSRIGDAATIIARGGPGGDLTKRGVTELLGVMDKIKKQPDQAGISTVKSHQLDYYKNIFAVDQSFLGPGVPAFKNPKGLAIFNHSFVPAFESAYSQWVAAGKDPMAFLSDTKQMDAIMDRIYPKSQRDADSISATNEGLPTKEQKVPASPEGIDAKAWDLVMKDPPRKVDGQPFTLEKWKDAINVLRLNPTPETQAAFDRHFAPSGYTAKDILGRLNIKEKIATGLAQKLPVGGDPIADIQTPQVKGAESGKENLLAADAAMKLTPQEKAMYERHLTNLNGVGGVDNADGSRSTLFQASVDHNGKTYNIPTVWDGKILSIDQAIDRVKKEGWDKFPSYANPAEAEARYEHMHKFMEKDTSAYFTKKDKRAEAHTRRREQPEGFDPKRAEASPVARPVSEIDIRG